ncbi:GNAT family N-acetyltransferase [Taibaiella lutea]|uniref:GNAT family N-acetyltransferase n=1 Tax=Taibaiella lutea TaxID=2608001 RepID=A0A5M6CQR2_9BACT|nr:GNAT family protein [Taibaiella lutea]KAA5536282.1 GNAT family N-acetyltransferase [Taibaiella lutea]
MASSNIIETPRLLIRMDTAADYIRFVKEYDDATLKQYFGWDDALLAAAKEKVSGGLHTYRTSVMFAHFIEKASGTIIGDFAFHNWFPMHNRSEIGYAMRNDVFKNKGFMKEAIRPLIDYGFEQLNLNRMEAFIGPNNIASQKTVQSVGFKQEGVLKEHFNVNGKLQDSLVFALLKSEYKS